MKKGRRLLITLLATLAMLVGTLGVAYAVDVTVNHDSSEHGAATITAAGETLTVECDYHNHISGSPAYDQYCEFRGGKTVTIRPASNLVYNGQQKPVTVEGLGGGITKDRLYYTGTEADGTTYDETSSAPTNAGTYTASLKVKVRDEGEQIITKKFTIQPKPIPQESLYWQKTQGGSDSDFNYEYDKQSHVPYAYVESSVLVGSDTCSVTVTGEQTDAGSYTATATEVSNKNYKLPESPGNTQAFKIKPKTVSFEWDLTGAAYLIEGEPAYYYTGEPQSPTIKEGTVTGVLSGDDCDVIVAEDTIKTEVGYYSASPELTGADKDNYTFGTMPLLQKYHIVKRTVVPVWDDAKLIYNAKVQHPEVELAYKDGSDITDEDKGKVEVKVYSDEACETEVTDKTVVGTTYYAKATLTDTSNFEFAQDAETVKPFIIYAKPVTVTLTSEDPITYDAQWHKPEVEIEGVEDGDDCVPVESLKGKTKITMVDPETGAKTNIIDIEDVNVDAEKGVYHASVDKYIAKVENTNTVAPEHEDYDVSKSGLKGDDARNYVLDKDVTCKFAILPLEITLDWYRPAYDEYGDEVEGADPVLIDVANGENLKLVFNGKKQAPVAKIKESLILTNPETNKPDECKVTVSAPKEAVEARPAPYTAEDISFSNPDYTRDKDGVEYYIIARPVKLEWNQTETTYNGKKQECEVTIKNIQKNDRGQDYSAEDGIGVVEVSKITYTPGFHFGTDGSKITDEADSSLEGETGYPTEEGVPELGMAEGTAIAEDRTPIDAGTYVMTAAELSDPFNYTLVKIDPESIELDPAVIPEVEEPAYVNDHHPIYTIHQHKIATIDWKNIKRTYNASNQKPIAELSKNDLQGPDTVKEVVVMIHDDLKSELDDFAGKCNVGEYLIYVLKNETFRGIKGGEEVDRSMNYRISGSPQNANADMPLDPPADDPQPGANEEKEPTENLSSPFVINKRPLVVSVNNKTGYYGDNPAKYTYSIKYSGLINGDVNKDDNHNNKNVPGKYTNDKGVEKKVVDGTVKYSANYSKWGKPGKYSIKASGLTSDNYAIKYVAGTLTIKNRLLTGDLLAKAKAGNKKGTISWTKVYGAAKYKIYFSRCNHNEKKITPKLYKTVKASKKSLTIKKLKRNTYYKFYVVALDKNGKRIAQTPQHHFCTNNVSGNFTNPKKITPSKKKITLKVGKTYKLKAKVKKVKSGKKLTNGEHTKKIRYKNAAPKVATVTKGGKIKAVGKGWCRIYVMAANGIWKTVEVTVK